MSSNKRERAKDPIRDQKPMTSLPKESIQISDDEVIVDAELLATCLDLSVASLREAMGAGDVRTLVENGEDEDLGRMRLTFRYKNRQFSILREPDGQLHETGSPSPELRPIRPSIMQLTDPR
jgi:hypothetical protein